MMTIGKFERMSGVKRDTIRYYCEEGLLAPERTGEGISNNRRLYDEDDLRRLQQICIYRKLGCSIAEIKELLGAPDYDPLTALDGAIESVEMEIRQLQIVAFLARVSQVMGTTMFSFGTLSDESIELLAEQLLGIPGFDDVLSLSGDDQKVLVDGWADACSEFGKLRDEYTESAFTQALGYVDECYDQIECAVPGIDLSVLLLLSFGFVGNGLLAQVADRAGGDGTAEFMSSCFMIAWAVKITRAVVPAVNELAATVVSGNGCSAAVADLEELAAEYCGADLPADLKKALGRNSGRYPMEFIRENVEQCASNDLTWDLTGLGKDEVPAKEAWEAVMSVIELCKSASS